MVKRFGLVILLLAFSITSAGFRDTTAPGNAVVPMSGAEIGPLDVVTSSVARGLAGLRSPPAGLSLCEDKRPEIRRAADDLFNVDDIARRALGRHWKDLAPGEQAEFVGLFRRVLAQSFVTIVERYTGDAISVDEEVAGAYAQVRSRITSAHGAEITIDYRLSRSGARWTVYDIVLDGVSLVSNYRSQLNAIIGTSSVTGLLEQMRAEPSRCLLSPDLVAGATIAEPKTSAGGPR